MAVVTTDIRFYNTSEFTWTGIDPFYDSDNPTFDTGGTFTFSTVAAPQTVTITDLTGEDAALTDKDFGDQFVDFADPSQVVVAEGGTYGNGTQLETAWRYNVQGSDGSAFQVWGVTFNQNDNAVEGIVSGQPFLPGVTYTLLADPAPSSTGGAPFSVIACFRTGTGIMTRTGIRPIETLAMGDLVWTRDDGWQTLRWVGRWHATSETLSAHPGMRPVRIAAGALGPALPLQDLHVSGHHRILVRSAIARRMFETPEVLVPARHLTGLSGVETETAKAAADFVHLLLDRHQIIQANGAWAETLYAGRQALSTLPGAVQVALSARWPNLLTRAGQPARPLVSGARARRLIERHQRNGKPLQMPEIVAGVPPCADPHDLADATKKARGVIRAPELHVSIDDTGWAGITR